MRTSSSRTREPEGRIKVAGAERGLHERHVLEDELERVLAAKRRLFRATKADRTARIGLALGTKKRGARKGQSLLRTLSREFGLSQKQLGRVLDDMEMSGCVFERESYAWDKHSRIYMREQHPRFDYPLQPVFFEAVLFKSYPDVPSTFLVGETRRRVVKRLRSMVTSIEFRTGSDAREARLREILDAVLSHRVKCD